MEQQLWFLKQHFTALQDYRRDIQRIWQDNASQELNQRYLNPHETDGEALQLELHAQLIALEKAVDKLAQADAHGHDAAQLAENVSACLSRSERERKVAFQHLDVYGKARAEAEISFPAILGSIKSANGCCKGILADPKGSQPTLRPYPNAAKWAGKVKPCSLGKKYPAGVPFDNEGFPDFTDYAMKSVRIQMTGNYYKDFVEANRVAGYTETPEGYTWHHHQDRATMLLIPSDLHNDIRHAGGHQQVKLLGELLWT